MKAYLYLLYKTINFIIWITGIYSILYIVPSKYRVFLLIPLILYTYLWLMIRDEKENKKL